MEALNGTIAKLDEDNKSLARQAPLHHSSSWAGAATPSLHHEISRGPQEAREIQAQLQHEVDMLQLENK